MVTCRMCGEEITSQRQSDVIATNRLINHLFIQHTLPQLEELLRVERERQG